MSHQSPTQRAWATGLVVFAAVIMLASGIFQALMGLVALFNSEFYVVGSEYTFKFDVSTWGWIHLGWGILVLIAGLGLLSGSLWGRTLGVIAAAVSAVANFAFIPLYPVWSIAIIAVDIAIIWALTAHGRDVNAE